LGTKFNFFLVLFTFLAHRFLPKYHAWMQLLMFQIRMLGGRIDDQCTVPTPEERGEILRLRIEINHHSAGHTESQAVVRSNLRKSCINK
jgi:putative transposase